jgi:hypothetical protein
MENQIENRLGSWFTLFLSFVLLMWNFIFAIILFVLDTLMCG